MGFARKYRRVIALSQRPTLAKLILGKVGEAAEVLLDSFFPEKYPEARLWRVLLGLSPSYEFKRETFASILSQLKSQGLVERRRRRGRSFWRLTSLGRKNLADGKGSAALRSDGKKRIAVFDIPEKERAKRRWLRGELLALGYRQLQKSVWIGESPFPNEFIEALDTLELRDAVHLLRVEAGGTLRSR